MVEVERDSWRSHGPPPLLKKSYLDWLPRTMSRWFLNVCKDEDSIITQSFNANIQCTQDTTVSKRKKHYKTFWGPGWFLDTNPQLQDLSFSLTVPKHTAPTQRCHTVDKKQGEIWRQKQRWHLWYFYPIYDSVSPYSEYGQIFDSHFLSWKIILYFFMKSFSINMISFHPIA